MSTPQTLHGKRRMMLSRSLAIPFLLALPLALQAQRVTLSSRLAGETASAVDAGPVPDSQPLQLTLRLGLAADRSAALDQLLVSQTSPKSPAYHQWLTPQQFASQFGASADQIAATTTWLQSQGLTIEAVSPSRTRITISGTASQIQSVFAVTLRRYQVAGALYFGNSTSPSVPQEAVSLIAGISGLDDLPVAAPAAIARPRVVSASASAPQNVDPYLTAASAIDANAAPVLTFNTAGCSSDFAQSDVDAYHDLFRQANAQGITILATSGCGARGTGSFPASLSEVTALTVSPAASPFVAIAPRPDWQVAPGLPNDASRYEPDLTTASVSAFAQTLNTILQQTGVRQGNINAILYSLATTPGLYTQPDATASTPPGTWEPATGLGTVDLSTLLKVFPRAIGNTPVTISLASSTPALNYGQPLTLTAVVSPSVIVNGAVPTGTVSFTSNLGSIGSAVINNGVATLSLSTLNVGSYTVVANYSGDTNYAANSSLSATVTVVIVNGVVTATIAPSTNILFGSTATVTATVTLPGSLAAPSGTASAQVQGVAGSVFTSTLIPNTGSNSATANIVVSAPAPGTYGVQVTCAGNQNFQCQSPASVSFSTIKGSTLIMLSVTPSTPQAGLPVTISAFIANSGSGAGAYTFTGNVSFFDNGKLLATAAVSGNQATTTASLVGGVTHTLTATYGGDSNWNGSNSSSQSVTPILLPSGITLTSNVPGTGLLAGINAIFTATVFTTAASSVGPTGTVSFFDTANGALVQLGSGTLVPNGPTQSIAVFTTASLSAGNHSVYAVYNGDSNFANATSSPLALSLADYVLTMIPQTITINRGQSGQVVILLGAVAGFSGNVTFGCTPPANAEMACSFSPLSLNGGGSTTMTITTKAPVAGSVRHAALRRGWNAAADSVLAMLFCFVLPRRRRALPTLLLLLCSIGLTANLGCMPGTSTENTQASDPPPSDPGTPLGTQIFTITSAGSNGVSTVRHNYQYQVTIQ